jgi:hypothetical protein
MGAKQKVASEIGQALTTGAKAGARELPASVARLRDLKGRLKRGEVVAPTDVEKYNPVRDTRLTAGKPFIVPVTGDTAPHAIAGRAVLEQKANSVAAKALRFSPAEMKAMLDSLGQIPSKTNTKRITNTRIYSERPDAIAALAAARTAPENPALRELFGVSRKDLRDMDYEMWKNNADMPFYDVFPNATRKPTNNPAVNELFSGSNAQRIADTLSETMKHKSLSDGMLGWYQMQPLFDDFKRIWGERAAEKFKDFNALTGMASSGSDVMTELNRGSGAYMAHTNPALSIDDFYRAGGGSNAKGRPEWMSQVSGHPFHSTAHISPMMKYLREGAVDMDSGKVPSYIHALGVPEIGFQRNIPVADAHFARASGLPDIRDNWSPNLKNATISEIQALTAPYAENIAGTLGIAPVQAQALQWGAYAPLTGVDTLIGAPKLELLSEMARKTGQRLGISPREALDKVIRGEEVLGEFNKSAGVVGE